MLIDHRRSSLVVFVIGIGVIMYDREWLWPQYYALMQHIKMVNNEQ